MNTLTPAQRYVMNAANSLVNDLTRLAEVVDAEYSDACLDTCNTNEGPANDAQRLVRLLHKVALDVNGSGLCDSGTFERFVNYDG